MTKRTPEAIETIRRLAPDHNASEIARALGNVTRKTVTAWARAAGISLMSKTEANSAHMRRLHADPEFAKAHAERAAEQMRRLHADPEFAKANAERMHRVNADPKFAKANAERMRRRNADPEFRAKLTASRQGIAPIVVPSWVPEHLRSEFFDVAKMYGEERAASEVRRMKHSERSSA